jgi:hypothetical protein
VTFDTALVLAAIVLLGGTVALGLRTGSAWIDA